MDIDVTKVRELLDRRDEIDQELQALFSSPQKKTIKCGNCGEEGHSARTCPKPKS